MRTFNENEKEVLEILNKSNGLKFQSLFVSKVLDKKIIIDYKANSVKVRYKTKNFTPSKEELKLIRNQSNELHSRIYLAVTLVKYFEKEGLISLFQNQNREDKIKIGDSKIDDHGLLNEIEDKTIKALLLDYVDKILIITTEFNEFVKNGYISKDEIRQLKSIKLAWIGIAIAVFASLISAFFSLLTVFDKDTENFNKDFNNRVLNQDTLFKKIDNVTNSNYILNQKLDSLLIKEKETILKKKISNKYRNH